MDSQFHNWEYVALQKPDKNNTPKFRSNHID